MVVQLIQLMENIYEFTTIGTPQKRQERGTLLSEKFNQKGKTSIGI